MKQTVVEFVGEEPELLLDLCLEGALALRQRGDPVPEAALAAMRRLVQATEPPRSLRLRIQEYLPRILRPEP